MRHKFHPEVLLEFEEAVQFYKERGRTLSQRIAMEVQTTIAKVVATPGGAAGVERAIGGTVSFFLGDAFFAMADSECDTTPKRTGHFPIGRGQDMCSRTKNQRRRIAASGAGIGGLVEIGFVVASRERI